MLPNLPLAYSTKDAAAALGISRSGIYRLASRGLLTFKKISGRTVILREDMAQLLDKIAAGEA